MAKIKTSTIDTVSALNLEELEDSLNTLEATKVSVKGNLTSDSRKNSSEETSTEVGKGVCVELTQTASVAKSQDLAILGGNKPRYGSLKASHGMLVSIVRHTYEAIKIKTGTEVQLEADEVLLVSISTELSESTRTVMTSPFLVKTSGEIILSLANLGIDSYMIREGDVIGEYVVLRN